MNLHVKMPICIDRELSRLKDRLPDLHISKRLTLAAKRRDVEGISTRSTSYINDGVARGGVYHDSRKVLCERGRLRLVRAA